MRKPADPARSPPPLQMPPQASAVCRDQQLTLYFPLGTGTRSWMIACPPSTQFSRRARIERS
ncbi:MAG UNVERIFIED_CONTAM: hypothetical protein LVR18_48490 [Planctomycetaceae bacterium]